MSSGIAVTPPFFPLGVLGSICSPALSPLITLTLCKSEQSHPYVFVLKCGLKLLAPAVASRWHMSKDTLFLAFNKLGSFEEFRRVCPKLRALPV